MSRAFEGADAPATEGFAVPGLAHLRFRDVVGAAADDRDVAALIELHRQFFGEYEHVGAEIAANAAGAQPYPGAVVHQWLMLRDGEPVGLYLFDTNTVRRVVLRHFVALTRRGGRGLPPLWLGQVAAAITETGMADCRAAHGGRNDLLAVASEIPENLFPLWRRLGCRQVPELHYAEPEHGMHWADHADQPRFLDITLNVRMTELGSQLPFPEILDAAVSGFLLDHYRLPADNPRVQEILTRAASVQ